MTAGSSAGTFSLWSDYDSGDANSEINAFSTISFTGATQFLFADTSIATFAGGYSDQSGVDPESQSEAVDQTGDIIANTDDLDENGVGYDTY